MPPETLEMTGPSTQQFSGNSFRQNVRRVFHATRPKFLPASILPVVAGSAWGFYVAGQFDVAVCLLALVATACVHAGANVLNDVGDEIGGTDRANEDRIYPYSGGSRFIQAGIMSVSGMVRLGISLLSVAAVAGLILLWMRGWVVLGFGLAGVLLAVTYSLGPLRLASIGLGEAAVGVAFGVLPVCGAAWLQSGVINLDAILFSLPISAWVASILLINEVPDVQPDGQNGKRTLPVRMGLNATATLYLGIQSAAFLVVVAMIVRGQLPIVAFLVPAGLLLFVYKASTAIRAGIAHRQRLTAAIEGTLAVHTLGCLWLTALSLYLAFFGD